MCTVGGTVGREGSERHDEDEAGEEEKTAAVTGSERVLRVGRKSGRAWGPKDEECDAGGSARTSEKER